MRISDWSSDVCSSDLRPTSLRAGRTHVPDVPYTQSLRDMAPTSPAVGRADAPRGRKAVGGVAPTYAFFGRCQPCTVTWRARATVSSPAGASLPIPEPAPLVAPLPIVPGATSAALEPVKAFSWFVVVDLFTPP